MEPVSDYFRSDVSGVPVVRTPADIDVTTADQLRAILLEASGGQHPVVVVDLSHTEFCDSAGLSVVIRAHNRLADQGRELRVVVSTGGTVRRVLALTGMNRYLHCFDSLELALTQPSRQDQDRAVS